MRWTVKYQQEIPDEAVYEVSGCRRLESGAVPTPCSILLFEGPCYQTTPIWLANYLKGS